MRMAEEHRATRQPIEIKAMAMSFSEWPAPTYLPIVKGQLSRPKAEKIWP